MRAPSLLMPSVAVLLLMLQPTTSLSLGRISLGRRALGQCVLGAGASLLPQQASASYAMGVAAQNAQSWEPTGKSKERAVYEGIESSLDEKRKYREEMGTLGYAGGEYTNYRRGAGRDKFDEENAAKKKKPASDYARVEDIVVMSQAKRMATP